MQPRTESIAVWGLPMKMLNCLARIVLTLALALTLWGLPGRVSAQQGFTPPDDVAERTADILSEGTRLTAHVFTPRSASAGERLPAIIMAQGWGGTQSSLFRDAAEFAQAGYYVVTFDFRGWGESDSRVILTDPMPDNTAQTFTARVRAVREVMDPLDMGMDWLNVLHWIQGEAQVDMDNIGVWGSSMAGGFAIYAAANDARVKAVHSQVTGTLDGRGTGTSDNALDVSTQRARGEIGYPEPRERYGSLNGAPIFARFTGYLPSEMIKNNDSVALQIVLAEEEQYGGNPRAIAVVENHDGPKNLVIIPGIEHYDIYRGARERAHGLAQAWFDRHLRGR